MKQLLDEAGERAAEKYETDTTPIVKKHLEQTITPEAFTKICAGAFALGYYCASSKAECVK